MNDADREMRIIAAAEAAHEVNRAYCRAIGDDSQAAWSEIPSWQRDSAIKGVEMIAIDPSVTPEQLHSNWLAIKRAEGWVYGEIKDVEKKIHPCIVPYANLPLAQRVKDEIFGAVVRGVLVAEMGGTS